MKKFSSDFLCIGPPKTGTTWLYQTFKGTGFPVPPAKEIKYFYEEKIGTKNANLTKRLFGNYWVYKANRRWWAGQLKNFLKEAVFLKRSGNINNLAYGLKFVLSRRNDDWYRKVASSEGRIVDITPKYAELSFNHIVDIRSRFPNLKILVFVRNPIYRTWSQAKMNLCLQVGKDLSDVPKEEFYEFFERQGTDKGSRYSRIITDWESCFNSNVKTIFLEDIGDHPTETFEEILDFLEVGDKDKKLLLERFSRINTIIGQGVEGEIPKEFYNHLLNKYKDEIFWLDEKFPGSKWPKKWLE